ncbi:MAG: hypothetical protein C0502_04145 [Opitutus sp.]|nr:hypothetical protein [Opitutus sp.]
MWPLAGRCPQSIMTLLRPNTHTRLIALLGLLTGAFGTAFWLLHRSHESEASRMPEDLRQARTELLDDLPGLEGESLRKLPTTLPIGTRGRSSSARPIRIGAVPTSR